MLLLHWLTAQEPSKCALCGGQAPGGLGRVLLDGEGRGGGGEPTDGAHSDLLNHVLVWSSGVYLHVLTMVPYSGPVHIVPDQNMLLLAFM